MKWPIGFNADICKEKDPLESPLTKESESIDVVWLIE